MAKGTSVLPVCARTTWAWKVMSVSEISDTTAVRLQEFDRVVAEGRQHQRQRLRQDDVAHALPAREVERDAGLVLFLGRRT